MDPAGPSPSQSQDDADAPEAVEASSDDEMDGEIDVDDDIPMASSSRVGDQASATPSTSVDNTSQSASSTRQPRAASNYRSRPVYSDLVTDSDSDDDTRMELDNEYGDSVVEIRVEYDDFDLGEYDQSDSSMDSDFINYLGSTNDDDEDSNQEEEPPAVLLKRKPKHSYNIIRELLNRETGMLLRPGRNGKSDIIFEQKFYGSLHAVERLELMYKLNKHKGCVNSLNFHPEGNLLASGSDDLNLIIWEWTTNVYRHVVQTEHKSNILQSKFLYLNAASQLNIVSCARDGQVLLTQILASGGPAINKKLAEHSRPVLKLYTHPAEPHIVVSAGEDGQVILSDVRQEKANELFTVKVNDAKIALFSISGHPLDVNEMCLAGRDRHIFVYDRRKVGDVAKPVKIFGLFENKTNKRKCSSKRVYVTCAVYNHNGSEILASYNEEDIYLFDTNPSNNTSYGYGYSHSYSGHRNSATFKNVSYFGPQSEFIVSGSDCGNIFIWDKKTESIVQWMMGDEGGVVNCLECHPRFPILATSGLDRDVKIWVPSNETEPKLDGLRETVIRNTKPLIFFFPPFNDEVEVYE